MSRTTKTKSQQKQWNIKLRVDPEEESTIKKEAIDYQMGLAEFIKEKLLDRLPANKQEDKQKTA